MLEQQLSEVALKGSDLTFKTRGIATDVRTKDTANFVSPYS